MKTLKKLAGFTLIELLVVIAIIGILAAALIPAVTGALLDAKVNNMMSNGKQIYTAIFSHQMSDPIYGTTDWVFPETGDFTTSTDYFETLVTTNVMEVNEAYFAGPHTKIGTANGIDEVFKAENIGWSFVEECAPESAGTPFLISSNLEIPLLPIDKASVYESLSTDPKIMKKMKENVVVIMTGGGGNKFKEPVLKNSELFNPGNTDNVVVDPGDS